MTTKLEYLKKCIVQGQVIGRKDWYICCFALPVLKDESYNVNTKQQYDIVIKHDGLCYLDYNEENNLIEHRITDYVKNEPLFQFQQLINVDSSWLPTIKTPQETKIGVLIVNALVLYPSFKTKVEYMNKKIKFSDIEEILVSRIKNDDVAKENDLRVPEMVTCIDRLSFLTNIAAIMNIATTPKAISRPPDIDKKKKELVAKYKDELNNPVKVVELEQELVKIDDDYLGDDVAAKNIFNKKSKMARKKLFLMYGDTKDFIPDPDYKNVVVPSLAEGVDTSPENFSKYMNDIRASSYSRGASTALSGYSYKVLQRSLSGVTVQQTPCDTTRGFERSIDKGNYRKLINRYVKDKGWLFVGDVDTAKKYIDKKVEIRSTMYCTAPGSSVCYACLSENYKGYESGLSNLSAGISSVLMDLFLKAMHSSEKQTVDINLSDLIT